MVNMITALCGYFSGTFVSDTGGTFKSDTPGTFVSDIGGTFEVILSHYLQKGKYQLTETVGRGGFGIKYKGVWFTEVWGSLGKV